MRLIRPDGGKHKGSCTCQSVKGCKRSTREGKKYCSTHIEESAYIQTILAKLRCAAEESAILEKKRGDLPRDSFYVREALLLLKVSDFTCKGLSRRLDLSHFATERLILMLAKWGLAQKTRGSRGALHVGGVGARNLIDD